MRKLARFGLIVALLGLPMGFASTGCSDDAGGNETNVAAKTKGTVAPDSPKSPEDYYKQHRGAKK